jgi:DNA mismatch repair protein MutS
MKGKKEGSMIDEYFNIYTENVKEYGDKTAILYQCGSFLEMYEIDNQHEKIGNARILSNILNMKYANKNGNVDNSCRTYPNFIGFTMSCLQKYLPILLDNDYTVVLVNQLESSSQKNGKLVKRGVTAVYSKCLQPLDLNNSYGGNSYGGNSCNLVNVFFEISPTLKSSNKRNATTFQKLTASICCVNNFTNDIQITENTFSFIPGKIERCLYDIDRILYRYFAKELHIRISNSDQDSFNKITTFFKTNYENVRSYDISKKEDKNVYDSGYQNEYFANIYKHIKFGLIQPVEYLNLVNTPLSIVNLIYTLNFMSKHDLKYICNLNIPTIVTENDHLVLELDTLSQLNIDKGVFNIVNHTKTAIGKRYLHSILCKPYKDPQTIEKRYVLTEALENMENNRLVSIDKLLNDIIDFEKLHRKMALDSLHPYEFDKLNDCYHTILDIIGILPNDSTHSTLVELIEIVPNPSTMNKFYQYIKSYKETFNFTTMRKMSLNTQKDEISNYFNKGIIDDLDTIQETINNIEKEKEELRLYYNSKLQKDKDSDQQLVKLIYNEGEGYSFTCTKIRYQSLILKLKGCNDMSYENFKLKQTNNVTKFFTPQLTKLSNNLMNYRELLSTKINLHYINKLQQYYSEYLDVFNSLKSFIQILDVTNSNLKCKNKYNYCRPQIVVSDSDCDASFIEATGVRHAIIERLDTGCEYISNDISLNNEGGMLLYGLNSSGKSSLLRAIGICVVLSQAGLYVPCTTYKYRPFHTMISQVDLTDNLYTGKSSFITEITGLKKILQCSGKNTLCLGDETLRGTECNSAMGLVVSMILKLIDNKTKFFFTSHLHGIPKIKEITELTQNNKLQIKHLSVSTKNNNIIFERILKDGPGSELYGIEVAQTILEDPEFIDIAFSIRNDLLKNKTTVLSTKKSVYNKKKIINKCEICDSTTKLETHHISEQKNADQDGFILNKHFHKNDKFNLTTLCHNCHLQVTLGKIEVYGYKSSTNGTFLDYSLINE